MRECSVLHCLCNNGGSGRYMLRVRVCLYENEHNVKLHTNVGGISRCTVLLQLVRGHEESLRRETVLITPHLGSFFVAFTSARTQICRPLNCSYRSLFALFL